MDHGHKRLVGLQAQGPSRDLLPAIGVPPPLGALWVPDHPNRSARLPSQRFLTLITRLKSQRIILSPMAEIATVAIPADRVSKNSYSRYLQTKKPGFWLKPGFFY